MENFVFEFEPTVTKELLLQKNSEEKYMEHYLGIHVGKGLFKSPLRSDSNPTCAFYKPKSGDLLMKDFGDNFCGNFISVVMKKFNVNYPKALAIIANDFGIVKSPELKVNKPKIEYSNKTLDETKSSIIQVEIKDFDCKQLEWWSKFGISKDTLKKFRVYSCENIFLNGYLFSHSTPSNPMYGYYGGKKEGFEHWRIYMPRKTKYRFLSNWDKSMIQGANMLPKSGDLLVITKSMKDSMLLYELGITAIAPNSESTFLSERQLNNLRKRFKNVVLFYDNDLAGVKSMKKIHKEFDIKCVWIPRDKSKDISDFYKKYGKNETIKLINYARKKIEA